MKKKNQSKQTTSISNGTSNQWLEEEDTKLIDLVRQHGSIGKWYK